MSEGRISASGSKESRARYWLPQGYVPFSPATPVLLVSLPTPSKEDPKAKIYLLGSVNFAALLDYNRSFFYAQSVTELAAALTAAKTTAA